MSYTTRKLSRAAALAVAGGVAGAFIASPALADVVTLSLAAPNSGISAYPGPYGSVEVDRTSNTSATITFTDNAVGVYQYLFTDSNIVDVNVNGSFSASLSSPTCIGGGCTFSNTGSGNVDGFGMFDLTTKLTAINPGGSDRAETLSFVLTATSGNSWASAADVLAPNSNGWLAAAHIGVCDTSAVSDCLTNSGATLVATGFAAAPEPATWALMALGFAGLGFAGYRKARPAISIV